MPSPKEIYTVFLSHCENAHVSWRGRELDLLRNVYCCHFHCDEVLSDLMQRYALADLIDSGIVVRADDGSSRLNSQLDGRSQIAIALHLKGEEHPFEIVLDGGCASGKRLAVCAALSDEITQEALEKCDDTLFVTSSVTDAVILRRCGIPAIVSAGLQRLRGPQRSQFVSCFNLLPKKQERSVFRPLSTLKPLRRLGRQIVLVGASIVAMNPDFPEPLRPVEEYLRQFLKFFELNSSTIKIWRPKTDFFEQFAFLLSNGNPMDFRNVLLSKIHQDSQCLVPSAESTKTGIGLHEAFSKWSIATGRRNDADLREHTWELLNHEWDESLICPLVRAAESCEEPVEANLRMVLAELMRMVHPLATKVSEKFRDRSTEGDGFFMPVRKGDDLDRLLPVANLVLRISKEVLSWKNKSPLPNLPFPRTNRSPY